jgi:hypothetical protein
LTSLTDGVFLGETLFAYSECLCPSVCFFLSFDSFLALTFSTTFDFLIVSFFFNDSFGFSSLLVFLSYYLDSVVFCFLGEFGVSFYYLLPDFA